MPGLMNHGRIVRIELEHIGIRQNLPVNLLQMNFFSQHSPRQCQPRQIRVLPGQLVNCLRTLLRGGFPIVHGAELIGNSINDFQRIGMWTFI